MTDMKWKDVGSFMLGAAALITALNSSCRSVNNSERLDRHKEEIDTNTAHIESTKDTVAVNAKILNGVAESVGVPPMAASPPNSIDGKE